MGSVILKWIFTLLNSFPECKGLFFSFRIACSLNYTNSVLIKTNEIYFSAVSASFDQVGSVYIVMRSGVGAVW